MTLPKKYNFNEIEPRLVAFWQQTGVYQFSQDADQPVFSIDTPPPTVSGNLHLGHLYSYSHTDFLARFWRMNGRNIFYPMGFDDNGLATGRLVEKRLGITATEIGRRAFIEKCLQFSEEYIEEYKALWQRVGLSIDWRFSYRTIDEYSRRASQLSFIDLYRKGIVYNREAPAIWCPECRTAIAQAELNDLERESEFITLGFQLETGGNLPIATTRPELLPACVAVFVHPDDERYQDMVGMKAAVPLFGQVVPILSDPAADPQKGTGVVMCCTFGDTTDVAWWYTHKLPLVEVVGRDGRLTGVAGKFAGLLISEAKEYIRETLHRDGLILDDQPILQSIRVHERCDTPVEYIVTRQWFIRVLDRKEELLELGDQVNWYPAHMKSRYHAWVENLNWDWCISRQRYYGVPFPLWYCGDCNGVMIADETQLPVDPVYQKPDHPCRRCGGSTFIPEEDVFDTWATSSLTPQIVGRQLIDSDLYARVFPFTMRPQAHEIIRTWAFYTIVKSHYHFKALPWKNVVISGWGIAGEGMGKISKSRGGGPMSPLDAIKRYSADAVRYWAASTGLGKDTVISEGKIQIGNKLVTKLWNVARFCQRFIVDFEPSQEQPSLSPADRWILSRLQRLIRRVTELFEGYDYATAKSEVEIFFWTELADNYLEMSKQRLYAPDNIGFSGARYTLFYSLLTIIKLFAPFIPFVTEEIYQQVFALTQESRSIHSSTWPVPDPAYEDDKVESLGRILVDIATALRRYKSERSLPLGTELSRVQLATVEPGLKNALREASDDLRSITRAQEIQVVDAIESNMQILMPGEVLTVAVDRH